MLENLWRNSIYQFLCSITSSSCFGLSLIFAFILEEVVITKILTEYSSILYAGVLSGGIAFTLQMFAQKNIEEAPAAIIYSLEGVFATIAGWIILSQVLNINNIIGCVLILIAVIFSQIAPTSKKSQVNN